MLMDGNALEGVEQPNSLLSVLFRDVGLIMMLSLVFVAKQF